ncbi:hypothetical protein GE09DRAFT_1089122 [Coniochaeta sp. 2T2.1]|nr:hypothetical protein GE09DRAFT_1089122 [Coniochaeta sp. 2T2.1]
MPIEPLRRQGSGADLSPIDECRAITAVECDGKRRLRLERVARELALLQADFMGGGGSDDGEDEVAEMEEEEELHRTPSSRSKTVSEEKADAQAREEQHKPGGGKMHNCMRLARGQGKSYGRVFADPFSAAVVLLVLPFCPPLSVYLTFRECGGMNRHRCREMGVVVLLTVLGWVPGIIYALVVYFRHLPRPNDPQENQALHLSPRQRSGQYSDVLSEETGRTASNASKNTHGN